MTRTNLANYYDSPNETLVTIFWTSSKLRFIFSGCIVHLKFLLFLVVHCLYPTSGPIITVSCVPKVRPLRPVMFLYPLFISSLEK